jgi:hypothetical protein
MLTSADDLFFVFVFTSADARAYEQHHEHYTNRERITWLTTGRDGLCLIQSIANDSRLVRERAPRKKQKKKNLASKEI